MTSTVTISRTALEGVERVMRRCQRVAVIGLALIGCECRAIAIRPHDAVAVLHFASRERAALRHDEASDVWKIKMTQDEYHMSNEIDVASLTTCQVAPEGDYVRLNFEDAHGRPATLKLTRACVQQLAMTLPHLLSKALQARYGDRSLRAVFPLGDCRLEAAAGSKDLILTMMTPDGFEVAFSLGAPAVARIMSAFEAHRSMMEQGPTNLDS